MTSNHAQPAQDRILVLDVLRGFALFGVLLVNMIDFSSSAYRLGTLGTRGSGLDQIIDVAIAFFAITKFYLLFSFLFGVGFAVQMRRMEASGRPFAGLYLRRLFVLFVIGMIHGILIWDGDILRLYAVAGLLLLLVRKMPNRVLLGLALIILLANLVVFGAMPDAHHISVMMGAESARLHAIGTYGELVTHRLNHQIALDIQIGMVLVMFLIGLVVGRAGWLEQPERCQPFLRRWWKGALAVGLIGNALLIAGYGDGSTWLISLGVNIGAPALSFVYLSAVVLNAGRLRRLAPVGQMALSNYLTHSLVGSTLFFGYGFGLYDQFSSLGVVALVMGLYGAQIVLSGWWMRRFRFGPMEWVWRSLTYGEVQPIRRRSASEKGL